jgi:hypothetical protein
LMYSKIYLRLEPLGLVLVAAAAERPATCRSPATDKIRNRSTASIDCHS